MRRVLRDRVREPEVLRGSATLEAKFALAKHYRLPEEDRHRRRPPVNEKLLSSREVADALSEVFIAKCGYCESPLSGSGFGDVTHHRPIGSAAGIRDTPQDAPSPDHYGWLAYEWNNLFLTCPECNRAKRNFFPVRGPRALLRTTWKEVESTEQALLINPCRVDPRRHVTFGMDGRVIPRDEVGSVTIDTLHLDRENLVRAREQKFLGCLDSLLKLHNGPDEQSRLRGELDDSAPFAGAARIAVFDLLVDWCHSVGLAKPRFRTVAEDAARLAAVSTDVQWASLGALARARPSELDPRVRPMVLGDQIGRVVRNQDAPRTSLLTSIHIKNFKGVRELRLSVAQRKPEDVGVPCMMLLGENSTGKSSTLQAIALALMGEKFRARVGGEAEDFVPREDSGWQIDETSNSEVTLEFDTGEPIRLGIDAGSKEFVGASDAQFMLFAYGSRRFFDQELRRKQPASSLKSLFDPFTKIQHPGPWLQKLNDSEFDAVARAIRPILSLQEEDRIGRDAAGRLFVRAHGRDTPLDRLSDGYRSLLAMVLDIMRGLLDEWGDLYSAWGIVLIDEIETHLHPRWKMHIVAALRQAMPNVQFIATTHDPLCLRGMRTGEVQVLVRNEDHRIEALSGLPDVRGLRAEQLLTSEYFGLSSTADPEVEQALNRIAQPGANGSASEVDLEILKSYRWIGNTPAEQIVNEATRRFVEEASRDPSIDRSQVREAAVNEVLERLRRQGPGAQR
jgi:hypothetical protein